MGNFNYTITLDLIEKYKPQLLELATFNEEVICDLWRKEGEPKKLDIKGEDYDFEMPFYQKMILKFKQEGKGYISGVWNSYDMGNQSMILRKYEIYDRNDGIVLMTFFSYLYWWTVNTKTIKSFFNLSVNEAERIVEEYNKKYNPPITGSL